MDANETVEFARAALGAPAGIASIGPVIVDAHSLSGAVDGLREWSSEVYNATCLTVEPPGQPAAPIAYRCVDGQLTLHWRGDWSGWAFFVQIFAESGAAAPDYSWYWESDGNHGSGVADTAGGYHYFTTGRAGSGTEMAAYFTHAPVPDGDQSEWGLAKAAWVAFEIEQPE